MSKELMGYQALASAFRGKVEGGLWRISEAIPSEASLAKEYGVAVGTIRQAIALLADDGVLIKRHGKSTVVSSGLHGQSMLRFFRYQLDGQEQLIPQAKVLDFKEVSLDKEIGKLTGWACKSLMRIHRLRFIDGRPVLYETIYLPLPKFKKLIDYKPKDFEDLFYPMYAKVCGVAVIKAKDQVGFELMKKVDAKALLMKEGHPAVRVNRIAFDLSGKPVEYRSSVGDAMAFQYSAEVN
ncbi:GntR family transcriptional regulator [Polynucleobacter sp. JS-Polo-80-F4]|uniref:GntR family transcriptional regulator n=1 Tax=Polynucleobacter sp. JS-Polo-80-F4 TaxID=2576918 RepID=UPI001C0D1553|nr:GntR family transcriptional regulator [Polynucleobacter sp. JS-Polo-80-F4]MBU3616383.1 GntR family transcriptional regulator [Polynucleobacter sp. JS-Polo-80-F4]